MSTHTTIVLVHGAFADAASWAPVTRELLDRGHRVAVPPVYNRSLSEDAASIRAFVEQIDGHVVLAGHSYGGAVIGVAGVAENVTGLVFVSGYVLEVGESLGQLQSGFPESELGANLVYTPYPIADAEPGTDVSVKVEAFPAVFASGVDQRTAEVLAVSQRPLSGAAFGEPASAAAWKTKPGWGIVSAADRTIHPDVERFGYQRAGLREVLELDAPHLVMQTHPMEVADLIDEAVRAGTPSAR